jgi:phage/plasmid-associated DNA primase
MGVQGSGKDTFVQILEKIMGHISRPTTKEFLEQFNGWMLDTHFAQLDEYGNQLSLARDKDEALGKLKAYTGKDTVQIRKMRTDGFDYKHRITFIMTANKNPLMLEDGDRRIAFFATPTVLTDVYDDVPELHRKIMSETKDLCYYLATEVEMMPLKAYMTPPMTEDKHELVANSMHAAARLAYAFKHNMIDYVKNLALDVDQEFKVTGTRVYLSDLEDIYLAMTDYNGDMKSLVKTFRSSSLVLHRSSKGGEHSYYFEIEDTF